MNSLLQSSNSDLGNCQTAHCCWILLQNPLNTFIIRGKHLEEFVIKAIYERQVNGVKGIGYSSLFISFYTLLQLRLLILTITTTSQDINPLGTERAEESC